jgi:hypothetical protein
VIAPVLWYQNGGEPPPKCASLGVPPVCTTGPAPRVLRILLFTELPRVRVLRSSRQARIGGIMLLWWNKGLGHAPTESARKEQMAPWPTLKL